MSGSELYGSDRLVELIAAFDFDIGMVLGPYGVLQLASRLLKESETWVGIKVLIGEDDVIEMTEDLSPDEAREAVKDSIAQAMVKWKPDHVT
jgi:hypothetical protein